MQQPSRTRGRRRLVRYLPDACLAVALLVVLALSLEEEVSGANAFADDASRADGQGVAPPRSMPVHRKVGAKVEPVRLEKLSEGRVVSR